VPREDRPEMVRSLRSQEMSLRAIATAMGVSERTVRRDLDLTNR
jgi:DeoR/GlpR family transcriptional regulator of sugar metabolism